MEEEFVEEENVYGESGREDMVDNDEISPKEEAFMKGYDDAEGNDSIDDEEDQDED